MSSNFKWDALFLDNTPISTPNYSNNKLTGNEQDRGTPLTNYADKMARLAVFITAEEKNALKTKLTGMGAVIDRLAGADNTVAGTFGYIDFLLQSATHNVRENISVSETLDDLYAGYSFGQAPPVFQYSVVLLNNKQDQQAHKMYLVYRELLRGHSLAHHRMLAHMTYDGYLVSGYLQDFTWGLRAEDESYVTGQFNILVKSFKLLDEAAVRSAATFSSAQTLSVTVPQTNFINTRLAADLATPPPPPPPVEEGQDSQ